jgi:hypothetical protein
MVCRDFILPEPASYVFFYAFSNLRNLLYIIQLSKEDAAWAEKLLPANAPEECCMRKNKRPPSR